MQIPVCQDAVAQRRKGDASHPFLLKGIQQAALRLAGKHAVTGLVNQQMHRFNKGRLYNMFCKTQASALKEVAERVEQMSERSENEMIRLAVELSMEANARRIAAEKIVNELSAKKKELENEETTK